MKKFKRRKVQQVRFRQTTLHESAFIVPHVNQTDDQHGVDTDPPSPSLPGPSSECRTSARPSRSRACKKTSVCQEENSSSDDGDTDISDQGDELWSPTRTSGAGKIPSSA